MSSRIPPEGPPSPFMFHSKLRSQEDKVGIFIMKMANLYLVLGTGSPVERKFSGGFFRVRTMSAIYREAGKFGIKLSDKLSDFIYKHIIARREYPPVLYALCSSNLLYCRPYGAR